MTAYELAKRSRVSAPRINDIVLEKRGISADTAVRLRRNKLADELARIAPHRAA